MGIELYLWSVFENLSFKIFCIISNLGIVVRISCCHDTNRRHETQACRIGRGATNKVQYIYMKANNRGKSEKEEIVATGKALQLVRYSFFCINKFVSFLISGFFLQAAQWLGLQETDVDETREAGDGVVSSLGQYAGLGYGKKKPSKKNNMWKLEEKLSGTLSHSAKRRKRSVGRSIERDDDRYEKNLQSNELEEEEEEEVGRSGVFMSSGAGSSTRENLLSRPSRSGKKKKAAN